MYLLPDNAMPYLGQVKLEGMNPYLFRQVKMSYAVNKSTQEWRDVCVNKDAEEKIADSVCRQLGFTNAIMTKASPNNIDG